MEVEVRPAQADDLSPAEPHGDGKHEGRVQRVLTGGREEVQFSGAVVYNTFPLPQLTNRQRDDVIAAGLRVITARENHPDVSLADLYSPLSTPPDIQTAHRMLDRVVDRIFAPRSRPPSVTDRMNILFPAYETMVGHLFAAEPVSRRRRFKGN
ncbi:type IIL restriction-modification enzyme MmeI [Streptomyces coelicoflavus]|uniref:type IIL restriction-modification enzyme MmeI n=1 Tax=Streptomyces coelicoflavus TaxID=285562 RepID=UPI0036AB47E1